MYCEIKESLNQRIPQCHPELFSFILSNSLPVLVFEKHFLFKSLCQLPWSFLVAETLNCTKLLFSNQQIMNTFVYHLGLNERSPSFLLVPVNYSFYERVVQNTWEFHLFVINRIYIYQPNCESLKQCLIAILFSFGGLSDFNLFWKLIVSILISKQLCVSSTQLLWRPNLIAHSNSAEKSNHLGKFSLFIFVLPLTYQKYQFEFPYISDKR